MTVLRIGAGLAAVFTAAAVLTAGVMLRIAYGIDRDNEGGQ